MKRDDEAAGTEANPLAGVLDRLLLREPGPAHVDALPDGAHFAAPSLRRVIVVASLGADGGGAAFRAACRWARHAGRRVAALDLDGDAGMGDRADAPRPPGEVVAIARVPAGPERIRAAPPAQQAAVLERLRRHEETAEVLVARVPPRPRLALMRAAFLAGGMIVPVDDSDGTISEAFAVSRESKESFLDLVLHPYARDREAMRRYLEIMRQFVGAEPRPIDFDVEDLTAFLSRLAPPPAGGFTTALLAPDTPAPPAGLLEIGTIVV